MQLRCSSGSPTGLVDNHRFRQSRSDRFAERLADKQATPISLPDRRSSGQVGYYKPGSSESPPKGSFGPTRAIDKHGLTMKPRRKKPPRFTQSDAPYFLTFCTFDHRPLLHSPGVPEFLIDQLEYYKQKVERLVAYTIMPDHVHLLLEIGRVETLSNFLRDYKGYTSRGTKKYLTAGNGISSGRIWQPGTMDHCIRFSWDGRDYRNHLSYLFHNCWKHLRVAPKDFPYHNFLDYVTEGIFDRDFFDFDGSCIPNVDLYE